MNDSEARSVFALLSDQTRIKILRILRQEKECPVNRLCQLIEMTQPAISHHLALMRAANLVTYERRGRECYYSVVTDTFDQAVYFLQDNFA